MHTYIHSTYIFTCIHIYTHTHTCIHTKIIQTYIIHKTNIWVREKTKVTDVFEQDGSGSGQDTSAVYEITYGHWKPYERKRPRGRPARRWGDELDDYCKGTIWQRIVQDRQMWKQHAEAFTQPRDSMVAL